MFRTTWHIAKSVLIEAVRRRGIYVVVLVAVGLIAFVMSIDFFGLHGLTKFYREMSLKIMSIATALTVVVLAARQLPREFETRTIYPLLARPVSRPVFLAGKLLGVLLAAAFCLGLFMLVYVAGTLYLGASIPWALFLQYIYLQLLMMLVLAALSFWLSLLFNLDAAITLGVLLFILGSTFTSMITYLYDYMDAAGKALFKVLDLVIPQLVLLDLSEKTVHGEAWPPLGLSTLAELTLYGVLFAAAYFGLALVSFRRRPL